MKKNDGIKKSDIPYVAIANQIIEKLKNGEIVWRRTWEGIPPRNYDSGHYYTGVNFLNLFGIGSPFWITLPSIKRHDATLKEGASSYIVVFWKFFETQEIKIKNGSPTIVKKKIPFLRYYRVYNTNDVDGLPKKKSEHKQLTSKEKNKMCEEIITKANPQIVFGGNQPRYIPSSDVINIPSMYCFENAETYYATFFHELTHWTGHKTRLNREGIVESRRDDIPKYSFEELIAEFGAAFLCAKAQISNEVLTENSAAYIAGWLKHLNENPKWIVKAANAAQKATDYILKGRKPEEESKIVESQVEESKTMVI